MIICFNKLTSIGANKAILTVEHQRALAATTNAIQKIDISPLTSTFFAQLINSSRIDNKITNFMMFFFLII